MKLDVDVVKEFSDLYYEEFGETLDLEESEVMAYELLQLYQLLHGSELI